jgi:ribosomal protein S12 methylthiotransferase accessory factor YcaO
MTKGKPWDINEERQLRDLFGEGKSVDQIAKIMVKTRDAVLNKIYDLGLKREEEDKAHSRRLSSSFQLPAELPSVEEALKKLAAALKELEQPGLDQAEVLRLRSIISGVKVYKEIFADYFNYCELEERLVELEEKYAESTRNKKSKTDAPA